MNYPKANTAADAKARANFINRTAGVGEIVGSVCLMALVCVAAYLYCLAFPF